MTKEGPSLLVSFHGAKGVRYRIMQESILVWPKQWLGSMNNYCKPASRISISQKFIANQIKSFYIGFNKIVQFESMVSFVFISAVRINIWFNLVCTENDCIQGQKSVIISLAPTLYLSFLLLFVYYSRYLFEWYKITVWVYEMYYELAIKSSILLSYEMYGRIIEGFKKVRPNQLARLLSPFRLIIYLFGLS